jgi:hypothetical protein
MYLLSAPRSEDDYADIAEALVEKRPIESVNGSNNRTVSKNENESGGADLPTFLPKRIYAITRAEDRLYYIERTDNLPMKTAPLKRRLVPITIDSVNLKLMLGRLGIVLTRSGAIEGAETSSTSSAEEIGSEPYAKCLISRLSIEQLEYIELKTTHRYLLLSDSPVSLLVCSYLFRLSFGYFSLPF